MPSPTLVAEAARRLADAAARFVPCEPVRDLIGVDDVAIAYAVQRRNVALRIAGGAMIAGRKIGLTSEAVQRQLGVDRPDFGTLFDDMRVSHGASVAATMIMQPRVEAEIAFILGADLDQEDLGITAVRAAISHANAAIEICGSRIRGWDITFGDTVADNASSGAFVLGPESLTLDQFEPRDVTMTMSIDDIEVSTGTGAACLGDPLAAVAWLAKTARELGDPLRAGDVILSGALGPMHPAQPGNRISATVSGLGSVTVTFE